MRTFLVASLVSCATAVPSVPVQSASPGPVRPVHTTLLAGCRVAGLGERRPDRGAPAYPFEVFAAEDDHVATFVIAHPRRVHVTWTQFPTRAGRSRARLEIGGQEHVRFEGFADLYGRTFTALRAMPSVSGHLWARAGAPLFVMAVAETGDLFGSVGTPFNAPTAVVVRGTCADIAYVPEADERPARAPREPADLPGKLALFTSAEAGTPFTTVSLGGAAPFEIRERRGDRVRVVGEAGHLGVDAWAAPVADAAPRVVHSISVDDDVDDSRALEPSRPARVPSDTRIFGGDPPEPIAGATLERGARVSVGQQRVRVGGDVVVPFEFEDGLITALPGTHLWVSEDAVTAAGAR